MKCDLMDCSCVEHPESHFSVSFSMLRAPQATLTCTVFGSRSPIKLNCAWMHVTGRSDNRDVTPGFVCLCVPDPVCAALCSFSVKFGAFWGRYTLCCSMQNEEKTQLSAEGLRWLSHSSPTNVEALPTRSALSFRRDDGSSR